jgi:hypothetical protein
MWHYAISIKVYIGWGKTTFPTTGKRRVIRRIGAVFGHFTRL